MNPIEDIVALAATGGSVPGTVDLPGDNGASVFATATVNVGVSGTITAVPEPADVGMPVSLTICQTDPVTSECINPVTPAASTTVTINAGETPTFAVFVTGNGNIVFDPAANRVNLLFQNAGGETVGGTSVAVQTLP